MVNRYSAHIGYLFTEMPLARRISAAASAGFTAIEHPQPFDIDARALRETLSDYGLVFSQLAGGSGDGSKGEKGLAALPGRQKDFRKGFNRALEYAQIVDSPYIHPMAGVPGEADERHVSETYLENIRYSLERTAGTSTSVLIEAISPAAVPGYLISSLEKAAAVQDQFGNDKILLLVDTYHAAAFGTDLRQWIPANGHRIGHIHIADFPGRHEPGTGSVPFDEILDALDGVAFTGAIGFEYIPSGSTIQSVNFLKSWLNRRQ